jgi:hypothetical protein
VSFIHEFQLTNNSLPDPLARDVTNRRPELYQIITPETVGIDFYLQYYS